jgi:putative intracellular protease/amidase
MLYGAVCATPGLFMSPNKLLLNKSTGYPTFKENVISNGYEYDDSDVTIDEHCSNKVNYYLVTGRSPGDAMRYALELVNILNGSEKMEEVKKAILF